MEHVLIVDNLISPEDCDKLIATYQPLMTDKPVHPNNFHSCIIPADNDICFNANVEMANRYTSLYPQLNRLADRWLFDTFRIKWFEPGKFFDAWHCEHGYEFPYRIMCLIVYLSDHDCGTEFISGEVVKSVKGRGVLFPTAWTHTHRGQPCPDGRDRFIMNTYAHWLPPT